MERNSNLANFIGNFSLLKLKVLYLRPLLSSLSFLKFRKKNSMQFVRKHLEMGPSYSPELWKEKTITVSELAKYITKQILPP